MKSKFRILACFIFILTIGFGCKKQPGIVENNLTFSTFEIGEKVHLFNDTTKPGCNFKLKFEYPSDISGNKESLKKLQNLILSSYFGDEYINIDPKQAAEKYTNDYIASYKDLEESYNSTDNQEEDGGNMWMNYEQISEGKPVFNKGGLLSYGIQIYSYTGGAHGMATHIYQVFNLKDMAPIKLNDIFEDRNLDNISGLIKQKLAQKSGNGEVSKLEEMGYDVNAIIPTENFYINEKGITWQYNSYEIAPYAMGSPDATIGFEDLLIYMKDDSIIKPLAEILIEQNNQ